MTEEQEKFYEILCTLTGEQVADIFLNWHDTQLLTEEFIQDVYEEMFGEQKEILRLRAW